LTLISMPLGIIIGQGYNGTVLPLVVGIALLSGLSILTVYWYHLNKEGEVGVCAGTAHTPTTH
jgi:hypothetical protein